MFEELVDVHVDSFCKCLAQHVGLNKGRIPRFDYAGAVVVGQVSCY